MNILVINGSPKKNGKIAKILQEIIKGALVNQHKVELINLIDFRIKDCIGCMNCQSKESCIIRDDDIEKIEKEIINSDLIIFGTPTHWGNMSALMLRTMERLFGFLIKEQSMGPPKPINAKGKRAILVTACSTIWPINWIFKQSRACFSRLNEICVYSGIKVVDTFVLPGTFKMDQIPEKYLNKAKKIGLKIK